MEGSSSWRSPSVAYRTEARSIIRRAFVFSVHSQVHSLAVFGCDVNYPNNFASKGWKQLLINTFHNDSKPATESRYRLLIIRL